VIDPATLATLQGPKQASVDLINGTLRIAGTRGNDTIRVTLDGDKSHIVVRINGHRTAFAIGDVKTIYIYGYGGNDDISIYEAYGVVNARSKVFGGDGNDTIFTGSARDTVYGENGDDTVNTWLGNDIAMGGAGDDSVMAGAGNDTASGDDGTDWVNGGDGNDVVSGGNDNSKDHIEGGAGTDVLFGKAVVEIFYGGKTDKDSGNPDEVLLT
jgi:Ca2+-binding RTX toxin-like protein